MKLPLLASALVALTALPAAAQTFDYSNPASYANIAPIRTDWKRYVVSDYGAVGDGQANNTQAIQKAIDKCAADGGGVLVIPSGTFLSGALFFKQGVNLLVEKDAILKSTTNTAEFPAIYTRWEGIERYWTCGFLNFIGMKNVVAYGEGTIDGSGIAWMGGAGRGARGASPELTAVNSAMRNLLSQDPAAKSVLENYPDFQPLTTDPAAPPPPTTGRGNGNTPGPVGNVADYYSLPYPTTATLNIAPSRTNLPPINAAGVPVPGGGLAPPRSLVFMNCQNVRVSSLHLLNEARWGFVFCYSQDIVAENLTAFTETRIPSSDGMDIDSCKHMYVVGCSFDTGDDDITIKAGKDVDGRRVNIPCEEILIEKCRFGRGDGGAAMGSETSGGIRNVIVRDCVADNNNAAPVRIKTNVTRGGVIENITYQNITFEGVQRCFELNLAWTATSSSGPRMPPVLRNVKIINCSGTGASAGYIYGLPDSLVTGVTFENCSVNVGSGLTLADVTDDVIASAQGPGLKVVAARGEPITVRERTPLPPGNDTLPATPAPGPVFGAQ